MYLKTLALGLGALLGLASAGGAAAGAPVGSWYVSPEALLLLPDEHFRVNGDLGFGIAVGHVLNEEWDTEIGWAHHRLPARTGSAAGDLSFDIGELAVARIFQRSSSLNPFLEAGLGLVHGNYANAGSSTTVGAKLGGGLLAEVFHSDSTSLQLRGDIGVRIDSATGTESSGRFDPYLGVGLRFNFGGRTAPAAVLAPAPPPPVASVPAPPPAAPAPPPPSPPPPPLDSDHDGVPDSLDRCPDTPPGDKVDRDGCSLTIRLQVYFDNDSARIKPESDPDLDRLVNFLKDSPSAHGVLEGHTDSNGKPAHNLALSQHRADAVKAYLVEHGVDAGRIQTQGYGATRPIADNTTAAGRAQNRRVVFQRTDVQP